MGSNYLLTGLRRSLASLPGAGKCIQTVSDCDLRVCLAGVGCSLTKPSMCRRMHANQALTVKSEGLTDAWRMSGHTLLGMHLGELCSEPR